jgi:UDP-glucose 4-epimerase
VHSHETAAAGSIADRAWVRRWMDGADAVVHAATLHKPHVGSHRRQDFVDTNVTGTLTLLEEAVAAGVRSFIYTSTTSVFGDAWCRPPALRPPG